jgi:hypothetical protein
MGCGHFHITVALLPGERARGSHWIGDCVGPRRFEKQKTLLSPAGYLTTIPRASGQLCGQNTNNAIQGCVLSAKYDAVQIQWSTALLDSGGHGIPLPCDEAQGCLSCSQE